MTQETKEAVLDDFLDDLIFTGSITWTEEIPGRDYKHTIHLRLLDEGLLQEVSLATETMDMLGKEARMRMETLSRAIIQIDNYQFESDPNHIDYIAHRTDVRKMLQGMGTERVQYLYEKYLGVQNSEREGFLERLEELKNDFGATDLLHSEDDGESSGN